MWVKAFRHEDVLLIHRIDISNKEVEDHPRHAHGPDHVGPWVARSVVELSTSIMIPWSRQLLSATISTTQHLPLLADIISWIRLTTATSQVSGCLPRSPGPMHVAVQLAHS